MRDLLAARSSAMPNHLPFEDGTILIVGRPRTPKAHDVTRIKRTVTVAIVHAQVYDVGAPTPTAHDATTLNAIEGVERE